MDIILMLIFCYRNYKLAVKKEENPWKWAIITALVWIIFEITGSTLYASIAEIDFIEIEQWTQNPTSIFLILFFGILCGYLGYLLVRRALHGKGDD